MLNHHIKCQLLGSEPVKIGTDGWIRFVDSMGDDYSIVQAARQSYGEEKLTYRQKLVELANIDPEYQRKIVDVLLVSSIELIFVHSHGTFSQPMTLGEAFGHYPNLTEKLEELEKCRKEDERLLRRLMRDYHTSPYEQVEMSFQIQCPLHVARQVFRHRMASPNEYSMRYKEAIDSMEQIDPDSWRTQSKSNMQGSDDYLPRIEGVYLSTQEHELQAHATQVYKDRLARGVSREQARKDLPVSNYTRFTWKMDLHNLLHLFRLRLDKHAQKEVREFASVMARMVQLMFPMVTQAFIDYRLGSISLSVFELEMLSQCLINDYYEKPEGMTKSEFEVFQEKIEHIENFSLDKARNLETYLT